MNVCKLHFSLKPLHI